MKYIAILLGIFVAAVHCQPGRPPRPPPSSAVARATQVPVLGPRPTPTSIVSTSVVAAAPPPRPTPGRTSPPRPEGCSPGCGPTEICAKLGDGYCTAGQMCSVCIKMDSIRFPASALAGMFSAQPQVPSLLPGVLPPGALPPGALPPGALPPGALPPGAIPPGLHIPQQPIVQAQPQQPMGGGMNSFYYDTPNRQTTPNLDPFSDFFGFGTQQTSFQSPFGYNPPAPPRQNNNMMNSNSFMPLLFFEGLGFGGLGF